MLCPQIMANPISVESVENFSEFNYDLKTTINKNDLN